MRSLPIETRSIRFRAATEEQHRAATQRLLVKHGTALVDDWTPKGEVSAEIHRNQWLALCTRCDGAECVDPSWPLFVCANCGLGPVSVVFPDDREAIEGELLKRPDPATRGWLKGETLADLKRENKERL